MPGLSGELHHFPHELSQTPVTHIRTGRQTAATHLMRESSQLTQINTDTHTARCVT